MSDKSGIQWTDATWNPVTGCTRVSPGCDNCYAVKVSAKLERFGLQKYAGLTVINNRGDQHFNGKVKCHESALKLPINWENGAKTFHAKHKRCRRVFVNSTSDLFHRDVPFEFIDRVFAVMAFCRNTIFQVLTKRPEIAAEYRASRSRSIDYWETAARGLGISLKFNGLALVPFPLPNVWIGTSVEDQKTAAERIPHLLNCPAAIRFLSCEPLLGPIDLARIPNNSPPMPGCPHGAPSRRVDWVICGGESGEGARPFNPKWAQMLAAKCEAARIPFFFKQLGSLVHVDYYESDDRLREWALDRRHKVFQPTTIGEPALWKSPERDGQPNVMAFIEVKMPRKGGDPADWPPIELPREFPKVEVMA